MLAATGLMHFTLYATIIKCRSAPIIHILRQFFQCIAMFKPNQKLTVEARGVNATAVEKDIGTVNGVIHVIDTFLGIPSLTIAGKMEVDELMRWVVQFARLPT